MYWDLGQGAYRAAEEGDQPFCKKDTVRSRTRI